jgi:hypothetical protein
MKGFVQMQREKLQECVYCGSMADLTDEHVPPKLVFPKPRPSDLITVRACRQCNEAGSKDADYIRIYLSLHPFTKSLPAVALSKSSIRRGFERPAARNFLHGFIRSFEKVGMDSFEFTCDMGRIHEVIKRAALCLYVEETTHRLPESHQITAVSLEMLSRMGRDKCKEFGESFVRPLAQQQVKTCADGQFAYWSILDDSFSVWCLLFHGVLPFFALTSDALSMER